MLTIAQHGIENYYSDNKPKLNDFDNDMNYLNETVMNEDDFLCFRISERFNQILRDVYELYKSSVGDRIPQKKNSINEMTGDILTVLDKIKSGEVKVDSIEDAMAAMKAQMGVSDVDMADALSDIVDFSPFMMTMKAIKSFWASNVHIKLSGSIVMYTVRLCVSQMANGIVCAVNCISVLLLFPCK